MKDERNEGRAIANKLPWAVVISAAWWKLIGSRQQERHDRRKLVGADSPRESKQITLFVGVERFKKPPPVTSLFRSTLRCAEISSLFGVAMYVFHFYTGDMLCAIKFHYSLL
jgi:hypothetical protein